jgi:hypothetical protein
MTTYREIFAPEPSKMPGDDGTVYFYTIKAQDEKKALLPTTMGMIYCADFMGRIQHCDIGKRIYRIQAGVGWVWQVENDEQRNRRLAGGGAG